MNIRGGNLNLRGPAFFLQVTMVPVNQDPHNTYGTFMIYIVCAIMLPITVALVHHYIIFMRMWDDLHL